MAEMRFISSDGAKVRRLVFDETRNKMVEYDELGNEYDWYMGAYDYIIFGEDTDGDGVYDIIYAKNGHTGRIDFKGTDAASVIVNVKSNVKNGGKIFLELGTYEITDEIIIDKSLSLISNGAVLENRQSDVNKRIIKVESSDVVFDGLIFKSIGHVAIGINESGTSQISGVTIKNCSFYGQGANVTLSEIFALAVRNLKIMNCYFESADDGIQVQQGSNYNSENILITKNIIENANIEVGGWSASPGDKWVQNVIISDNIVLGGILIDRNVKDVIVVKNYVELLDETRRDAIRVGAYNNLGVKNIEIIGNIVKSIKVGINLDCYQGEISNVLVIGNSIESSGWYPVGMNVTDILKNVVCQNNIINGISMDTSGYPGSLCYLKTYSDSAVIEDVKIESNFFMGNVSSQVFSLTADDNNIGEIKKVSIKDNFSDTFLNGTSNVTFVNVARIGIVSDLFVKNNIVYNFAGNNLSNAVSYIEEENIYNGKSSKNSGVATFSGDGSTTQFSIPHGLVAEPSKVLVTPMSSDAAGDFYVTKDATNIYVNYKTAPPSGTDNIKLSWYAEV